MKIATARIPERMRAAGGALAGGRDVWRDSGAVSTQIAVKQSAYAAEVRDTHLHCRNSAPIGRTASRIAGRAMFGRAWQGYPDGYGVWVVVRDGYEVHRRVGVLNFAYPLQFGDTVWLEYVDRDGNRGSPVTHTSNTADDITEHQYVDNAGSDAADGLTPGTAVATPNQARLNMEAALGSNEIGAIHYKRDQVHTYTSSTPLWRGHTSTVRRRCILDAYDEGADPILRGDGTATAAVTFGNLDSVELHGLRLEGQRSPEVNCIGVLAQRSAGDRSPLNLLIRDCTLVDFRAAMEIQDSQHNKAARDLGYGDFLCLWNSTFDRSGSLHLFESMCARYVSVTNCFFGQTFGESGPNIFRVANWKEWVAHGNTFESQSVTSFRMQIGQPETSTNDINECGFGSISGTTLKGRDPQQSGFSFGRHAPANATAGWLHDVRMVNCRAENGRLSIEGVSGAQNYVDRFQVWNSTFAGAINLMSADLAGENGVMDECDFIDNATLGCRYLDEFENPTGTGPAFRLGGTRQRYAEGGVRIRGHKAIWPTDTEGFNENLIDAPRMLEHELRDRVDSDWNHTANQDAGVPGWVSGGVFVPPVFSLGWSASLATWQATTANDANSTARASSLLGVTSLGTRALYQADMDARPSGAQPLAGLGWPRLSALDADSLLRVFPTAPGSFDENAFEAPAGPPGVFPLVSGALSLRGAGAFEAVGAVSFAPISGSMSLAGGGAFTAAGVVGLPPVSGSLTIRSAGEFYGVGRVLVRGALTLRGAGELIGEGEVGAGGLQLLCRLFAGGRIRGVGKVFTAKPLLAAAIETTERLFSSASYFPAKFSSGKMQVDYSRPQKPQVKCEEVSLSDAEDLGRGFQNTQTKKLSCVVSFPQQVVFDLAERVFETPPLLELVEGGSAGLVLLSAEYTHPPEQDPNGQCKAEYVFSLSVRPPVSFQSSVRVRPISAPAYSKSLKEKVQNEIWQSVSGISRLPTSVQEEDCSWGLTGRRTYSASRESWTWRCVVQSARKETFEALELALSYRTITIPPSEAENLPAVFVALASIQYVHPPQQDPNRGSVVVVTFQARTRN